MWVTPWPRPHQTEPLGTRDTAIKEHRLAQWHGLQVQHFDWIISYFIQYSSVSQSPEAWILLGCYGIAFNGCCPKRSKRSISDRKLSRLARHKHQQIREGLKKEKKVGNFPKGRGGPSDLDSVSQILFIFLNMVWIIQKCKEHFFQPPPPFLNNFLFFPP